MIRRIRPQDRALFLEMSEEFYRSPAVLHPVPREYHTRTFEELMRSRERIECYILCDDDVPAGYALLQNTFSREGGGLTVWIDEIYIRAPFRGRGLGKEFFAFAETLGASRLRLEVEPENVRAIALYRALGYRPLPYAQFVKE